MSTTPAVWFITGAARGIGRALTEAALEAGDRVVATVRDEAGIADLRDDHPTTLHVEVLDVRDRAAGADAVAHGVERFGRLDVVVNNAGHGLVGTVEEVSGDEARAILETNFLGALWVTQAALPHLREQGSGHIVQISTVGGVGAMPTMGLYNASKWALEGMSEALAGEVAGHGIRVTIAELGGFATDWAGASMPFARPIPAYDDLRQGLFGSPVVPWPAPDADAPPTDAPPHVAAELIRAHVAADDGPLRLLVGDDAPVFVAMALAARRDDYSADPRLVWPEPTPGAT